MKSFIRWMGNKQKHIRHFLPFIPSEYNTYIEPFLGSGSLFLHLAPEKWIINDLNSDLIKAWIDVRDHPDQVLKIMKNFIDSTKGLSKDQLLIHCRKTTDQLNTMKSSPNKTALILILKHFSYSGSIFSNDKYYFKSLTLNLYKKAIDINYIYIDNFTKISNYLNLSQTKIYNLDYKKILTKAKQRDFVFLDPPYIETCDKDIQYNKNEKFTNFLQELYLEVQKLDVKGVKCMMTQNDSKLIRQTFKDYIIKSYDVYRLYTRTYTKELIIMNYKR